MESMFSGCKSLSEIILTYFLVPKINNLSYMLKNCTSLTSIDLSNFVIKDKLIIFEGLFFLALI